MKPASLLFVITMILSACSQEGGTSADEKKQELADARKEYQSLREKIDKLEAELKEIDPEFAKQANKAILVSTLVPGKDTFVHRIDVRGSVSSRRNVMISAEIPARIERVNVREGQSVSKGDVLVTMDADIINSNIRELKTQLELANTMFERQERLWKQKIGTEMQYLQAKNSKESLESRLAAAQAQLSQAIVRAPFSGTVDQVPAREGEMAAPGMPLVRLNSPQDMYIEAEVSERYLGKVAKGDEVEVYFPIQDKRVNTTIAAVSDVINAENRTFRIDVRLPQVDFKLKPNQVTVLKVTDYTKKEAVSVPTHLVLRDDKGEYVYAIGNQDKSTVAKKVRVKSGLTYAGVTEIVEGLSGEEVLIDKGFRDVAEGVHVAVAKQEEIGKVAHN